MPLHPRQEIREAVAALLTGATAAGTRVNETRVVPWKRLELPALAVYSLEETGNVAASSSARESERTLQLAVEGAVKATEDVDDALDALALEIEAAMDADETFGGKASDSMLSFTELTVFEDGDRLIGLVRLVYEVTYYKSPAAPVLDDFDTAGVGYNLAGDVLPADEANDVVDVTGGT